MIKHPLTNIAEWRKGCSCATGHPRTCEACTEGLVKAIEGWFAQSNGDQALLETCAPAIRQMLALAGDLYAKTLAAGLATGDSAALVRPITASPALTAPYGSAAEQWGAEELVQAAIDYPGTSYTYGDIVEARGLTMQIVGYSFPSKRLSVTADIFPADIDDQETERRLPGPTGEMVDVYQFGGFEGVRLADASDMMNEIARLREELDQALATIEEMGELIDSLTAAAGNLDLEP